MRQTETGYNNAFNCVANSVGLYGLQAHPAISARLIYAYWGWRN